tara:strand:- start:735 stop:2186 length:1452 start_codon:yes stop_codon:yes gene_type:complete
VKNYFKNKNFEKLYLFLLISFSANLFSLNFNTGETMYLGRIIKSESIFSAYMGDSHLVFFNFLAKLINEIGLNLKLVLNLIACLWMLFIILRIKEIFELDALEILLFTLLFLNFQSFFGAEFYFGSIEGKIFSYLSLFTAILYAFQSNLLASFFFYVLSFYFHASVAIASFPVLIIILLIKFKFKLILKVGSIFFLIAIPNLYYLLVSNFDTALSKSEQSKSLEFLITERLPHHLYPFSEQANNLFSINQEWIPGFIFMFLLTLVNIIVFVFYKSNNSNANNLNRVTTFSLMVFWFYVLIVWFFPISKFVIAYPFRITTSILFLTYLYICIIKKELGIKKQDIFEKIGIVFLIYLTINLSFTNYQSQNVLNNENVLLENTIIEISPEIIFLPNYGLDSKNSYLNSLEIKTNIPIYATYKFNTFFLKDLNDWKERLDNLEYFYSENCSLFEDFDSYLFIDYNSLNNCGNLIGKFGEYFLYEKIN